ncbi:hypothetical protein PMAC_002239 [Pneumocystis sp. 'macacae']|nr:hypothetical protein PMAC_002239 [Pneumocystis sp. 'macacae']
MCSRQSVLGICSVVEGRRVVWVLCVWSIVGVCGLFGWVCGVCIVSAERADGAYCLGICSELGVCLSGPADGVANGGREVCAEGSGLERLCVELAREGRVALLLEQGPEGLLLGKRAELGAEGSREGEAVLAQGRAGVEGFVVELVVGAADGRVVVHCVSELSMAKTEGGWGEEGRGAWRVCA